MNKPTYDWKWFEEHTPFKKIFEEYCDLTFDKEYISYQVFGNIWDKSPHFNITLNYRKLIENFDEIKNKLLNTRVCKYNQEVFDYVNETKCTNHDVTNLIVNGCFACDDASFSWNFIK